MKECVLCGGSALRDYAYGCDHKSWDEVVLGPSVVVCRFDCDNEIVWHAEGYGLGIGHPIREEAVREWRERYAIGLMVDALFRKLTGWAKEGAALQATTVRPDSIPLMHSGVKDYANHLNSHAPRAWVRVLSEGESHGGAGRVTIDRKAIESFVRQFSPGTLCVLRAGWPVGVVRGLEAWCEGAELWALIDEPADGFGGYLSVTIDLDAMALRSVDIVDHYVDGGGVIPEARSDGWPDNRTPEEKAEAGVADRPWVGRTWVSDALNGGQMWWTVLAQGGGKVRVSARLGAVESRYTESVADFTSLMRDIGAVEVTSGGST